MSVVGERVGAKTNVVGKKEPKLKEVSVKKQCQK